MKTKYIALWLLLTLALALVMLFSFSDWAPQIGPYSPKKAGFAETLLKQKGENALADSLEALAAADTIPVETVKTDSLPQSIFVFGDSMTYNIALRLAQYAKQNGHTIHAVNWDSSNTKIWADHDTLAYYINKYHPTQIFISLGSNELFFKDPSVRIPYIKKIIEVIDTIPYVWIGPPNWKPDTGMNDILEKACGRQNYFRTDGMQLARKADHIHPTREATAFWVDSVMRWLPKSSHPFLAEIPSDSIGKVNANMVFLKALNK